MSFIDLIHRIEYVDFLIRTQSTGSPKELSKKIGITERSLYNLLDTMRDLGADIAYNPHKKTYTYLNNGNFHLKFIRKKEMDKIRGGSSRKKNLLKNFFIMPC